MTIEQKLDQHKTEIEASLYPASKASEIANTKQVKRVIKWLKENNILFNYQNL
jgi:hypothetical protein